VFDRVRNAVDDLETVSRALDPYRLDGSAATALVELAARGERICSAIKALGARRVDETNAWRGAGHRSAAHWVAEATGETVGTAGRALETARALERLPQTDAAFRAGQLSPTQAAEITSAAGADPAAESTLLETAAGTGVKGLRDRWGAPARRQTTPRGAAPARRAARQLDRPDGVYRLEARLAPDAGRDSARGRRTPTGSSGTPAAPVGASRMRRMQPTRSSRWPVKDRASPLRSARWSTLPRSLADTRKPVNDARSSASVRFRSRRPGRCSMTQP
jgi:hypothetical protein